MYAGGVKKIFGTLLFALALTLTFGFPGGAHASQECISEPIFQVGGPFSTFEQVDYSDAGFLEIHVELTAPSNGSVRKLSTNFYDEDCRRAMGNLAFRSNYTIPVGVQSFSFRFTSLHHFDIWNDETDTMLTCVGCSVDIPHYPEFFEVYLRDLVGLGEATHYTSSSHRIKENAADPPIINDTLPPPEACVGQEFSVLSPITFNRYERVEYVDGLLRYHFKRRENYTGTAFKSILRHHGPIPDEPEIGDCFSPPVSGSTFLSIPYNVFPDPEHMQYFSVRFTSPTSYEVWNDDTEQPLVCDTCSVSGLEDSDYVSFAANTFNHIFDILQSTPFPVRESDYLGIPEEPEEPDPVIVIPGILGSWEKDGELQIDPIFHTYDDLINTFVLNGFVEGETIFPLAYEWRLSNELTAVQLRNKISEIQAICECDKVDIIAHSMGGLVARQYIQSGLYGDDVDQLIFLGTPHLGSAKSYLTWEGGRIGFSIEDRALELRLGLEGILLGYSNLFDYVRNKPILSVKELLPTYRYLRDAETGLLKAFPDGYPLNPFLRNLNLNVDDLLNSGVSISNIVGMTGASSTPGRFRVVDYPFPPMWEHGYPENFDFAETDRGILHFPGDGTVPIWSSRWVFNDSTVFDLDHSRIVKGVQSFVYEILTGEAPDLESDLNLDSDLILFFDILSPADIQVVAPDGKRVGKDFENNSEINEIDGAFYTGFNTDREFVSIPNPIDGEYRIIIRGTGDGGEYTIVSSLISDESNIQSELKSHILPETKEEFVASIDTLSDDHNEINDESSLSLEEFRTQIEQAFLHGWIFDKKLKEKLILRLNKAIFERNKGKEVKVEHTLRHLFLKDLKKGFEKEQISETGYNLLVEDVESVFR